MGKTFCKPKTVRSWEKRDTVLMELFTHTY
jgi:hypothetical protein